MFGTASVSSPSKEVVDRFEGEHAESLGGCRLAVEPWAWVSFVLVQSILEYSSVCFGVAEKHVTLQFPNWVLQSISLWIIRCQFMLTSYLLWGPLLSGALHRRMVSF